MTTFNLNVILIILYYFMFNMKDNGTWKQVRILITINNLSYHHKQNYYFNRINVTLL